MISIFNRKELARTCSTDKQADIRSMLAQYEIDYTYKVLDEPDSRSPDYVFFVHKKDFEMASIVINRRLG